LKQYQPGYTDIEISTDTVTLLPEDTDVRGDMLNEGVEAEEITPPGTDEKSN
jgi:hypothetical protein